MTEMEDIRGEGGLTNENWQGVAHINLREDAFKGRCCQWHIQV